MENLWRTKIIKRTKSLLQKAFLSAFYLEQQNVKQQERRDKRGNQLMKCDQRRASNSDDSISEGHLYKLRHATAFSQNNYKQRQ